MAIVSDKPQTTRHRIFGIANGDDYQLVDYYPASRSRSTQ